MSTVTVSLKSSELRCQICLRGFKVLRFNTERIKICRKCVEDLNSYHAIAGDAVTVFKERLEKGILKRLTAEMGTKDDKAKQLRAMREYNNLEAIVNNALPKWLNKMAGDKDGRTKEHKLLRAYRRGLLHLDRPQRWDYPSNWKEIARRIRKADKSCQRCEGGGTEIHVHHIVYKSHFGTNRQENLVSLCRNCHESEHGRELDFHERNELDSDTSSALQKTGVFQVESQESHAQPVIENLSPPVIVPLAIAHDFSAAPRRLKDKQAVADREQIFMETPSAAATPSHAALEDIEEADSESPAKTPRSRKGIRRIIEMLKDVIRSW